MNRSPSASGLLPLPGAPSSSWALYRARLAALLQNTEVSVVVAFWLFGLINNILYVLLLSAAQDLLVGTALPKAAVLLADVLPSFLTKLLAPYVVHRIPYAVRILACVALSVAGMLLVAAAPASAQGDGGDMNETGAVGMKMLGIVLASLSSGAGELSFLGLTHYYGAASLAAWGSGTGGAGLVGAGLYVVLTGWIGLGVRQSLLVAAVLPGVMLVAFFGVLPRARLEGWRKEYEPLDEDADVPAVVVTRRDGERDVVMVVGDDEFGDVPAAAASSSLLAPGPSVASTAFSTHYHGVAGGKHSFWANLRRARALFVPYMLPLLLVYVAEYTINQGVAPTLLFPLEQSPFSEFRAFYPFYGFLYQLGVFISRSSTPFVRIHHLYLPSLLQVANLVLLTLHALLDFIPSVYLVFALVFWEGLLGGAVYVNTFAEIMERVPVEDREFSLGATSVSDSGGICVAGFLGMAMEVWLCRWQVSHGRDYCQRIEAS
ncbi:cc449f17-e6c6-4163-b27c-b6054c0d0f31 [Thermothielavioides terrestris]|uniref:Protein BTN n=2 Tax=Thermothielavioides terrestris TaxID=2587410 RepID=G2RH34_THETT|nr:uncharacterized protein THITE_2124858 [Thermothielavioides terrestris NRRL 8126]AEO71965.1 hypothetical protein THITE_2124858 [Thermothielavioides terrestris NRRL 8126]SPQ27053.1 cc449f17-e6c6-4163-b27c-b6054c0d0f31 [Thermothielavioides terrestris]